ncbi:hypothetical protein E2C01_089560 [Portunus trituberculatus]|uniref:Uncharacterized protein n=1 Tax=Portunus trituberculatus TaxID=210409 RepID=A0A5B7JJ48_PORTR|nr:hypothetical protein [Portunus trituberculatus]
MSLRTNNSGDDQKFCQYIDPGDEQYFGGQTRRRAVCVIANLAITQQQNISTKENRNRNIRKILHNIISVLPRFSPVFPGHGDVTSALYCSFLGVVLAVLVALSVAVIILAMSRYCRLWHIHRS